MSAAVAFHTDLAGIKDRRTSILEADRAVSQLLDQMITQAVKAWRLQTVFGP